MQREALPHEFAMRVRDGQVVLVCDDTIPEGGDVAELLLGGEFVESGGWDWERLCHGTSVSAPIRSGKGSPVRTERL